MITTNIVLKKGTTILKIKSEKEKDYIKTYCIISCSLNKTSINSNFKCNENISIVQYMKLLDKEITPLMKDFNILMQGV